MFSMARRGFFLGAFLTLVSSTANAAIVTVFGDDVSFTYENASLFGTGTVVGNSIFFLPTNFKAQSLNGEGLVTESETLNIVIKAVTEGFVLEEFQWVEEGDYELIGDTATVEADGQLRAVSNTIAHSPMTVLFDAGPLTVKDDLTLWDAGATIDLTNIPTWMSDTNVTIQIQNNLDAFTGEGDQKAFIQKKFGNMGVIVNPIPVPAAVWLFGSGLLGLVGVARRRKTT